MVTEIAPRARMLEAAAERKRAAYALGRNTAHRGLPALSPYACATLTAEFQAGHRHAQAEQRLDADTAWD